MFCCTAQAFLLGRERLDILPHVLLKTTWDSLEKKERKSTVICSFTHSQLPWWLPFYGVLHHQTTGHIFSDSGRAFYTWEGAGPGWHPGAFLLLPPATSTVTFGLCCSTGFFSHVFFPRLIPRTRLQGYMLTGTVSSFFQAILKRWHSNDKLEP